MKKKRLGVKAKKVSVKKASAKKTSAKKKIAKPHASHPMIKETLLNPVASVARQQAKMKEQMKKMGTKAQFTH